MTFIKQRFPRFEVYYIAYDSSPTLPLRGLSALHMQVDPCKAALQSTYRHLSVRCSHWEWNSHCSRISTWPVPSRRVHMCQASNNLQSLYKLSTDLSVWEGRIWVEKCWWIFNWELDLCNSCWRYLYCDEVEDRCWRWSLQISHWVVTSPSIINKEYSLLFLICICIGFDFPYCKILVDVYGLCFNDLAN